MAEATNNGATKARITLAVLKNTIELQGEHIQAQLGALADAIHAIGAEQRVLHDRIDKAKEQSKAADFEIGKEITALKTRTGLIAGLNSLLAVIASAIAGIWATRS